MDVKRRDFIKAGFAAGAFASLDLKFFRFTENAHAATALEKEKVVRSTCSPNCTGACGFNASVKDGRITTLIQAADYPEDAYNPRGCLKGLSMMNLIYGKDRLKYPLIRTGERGSGEFRKASWEEALDYAAKNLKGIMEKYGSETVTLTIQVPGTGYVHKGAFVRLAALNHWSIHHGYDQNGDLPMFWPMTFGVQSEELESAHWPEAKYTMVFGSNIIRTRLPDAKHLIEAKNNGKLVVFDPDYNATAAKADEWVPIKADTDAAMALGMAKVIIDKKLYDEKFLSDFTDMPILVRTDNSKRLLAQDVKVLLKDVAQKKIPSHRSVFVVATQNGLAILDPENLSSMGALLEGEHEVTLKDDSKVMVKTVFETLKISLEDYSLGKVSKITEVPREQIEKIAVEVASAVPLHLIYGASNYQWYNGDLKGRALSLLPVLTGSIGKLGGGISTYAGQYRIRFPLKPWWGAPDGKLNWVPFLHMLQGKGEGEPGKNYPEKGIKAWVSGWGNPFDQHNMANILRKRAKSGDLEFLVSFDFQMTTTANWSDVIFPATSWYENYELTATILHPFMQLQNPAIKNMFESKTGLYVCRELARRLKEGGEKLYYPDLDEHKASVEVVKLILENGGHETKGATFEALSKGPVRLNGNAPGNKIIPFYEQIEKRVPFPPVSYPSKLSATAKFVRSGRIEFYKDEDLFIEMGEHLPVHKDTFTDTEYKMDPSVKEKYKLRFVTKNSLYRVHSTHSNNPWMNELQGHKPKIFLNEADALSRKIASGDEVLVYNNRGEIPCYAIIDPGIKKGAAVFDQGWWARYLNNASYNSLTYPWIKPLHEIYFVPGIWSPTTSWNECLVDVKRRTI